MLDAAAAAAATATGDRPRDRTAPPAVAGRACRHQPESRPRLFADRDRRRGSRSIDFVLLSLIGIALYFGYVVPLTGFRWEYVAAIFGMTVAAVICFQAADIYRGPGVSRPAAADDADDLVLGVRVPAVHRRVVLRQARQRGFAALAVGVLLRRSGGA